MESLIWSHLVLFLFFLPIINKPAESTTIETTVPTTITEPTTTEAITTESTTTQQTTVPTITTISTTTTTPPTTTSTTVAPTTTPRPCFDQRNFTSNLLDHCGVHGGTAKCGALNTACMTTLDNSGDWRCRCIRGYIQNNDTCDIVPSDLFTSSFVANTVEISLDEHSPSDVLVFSLPTIVGTSTVQRSSCTVNVQSVFYCNISSGTVNVYVKTTDALMADDIYYRLLVHATAEVDYNGISGSVERSVKLMKPVKRYSASVVDTAQPGHQLMYLPINVDVRLKVNSTAFSIDEKRIIYVKRNLDSLHDSSTIFFTIVIKVYEELSRRTTAIIDVYVVRPKVQINVQENVRKDVVSFEKPGTIDVRLADYGDASEFLVGTNVVSMNRSYDYEQTMGKVLSFTAQFNSSAEFLVESRVSVLITDEDDVPPSFDKRSVTVTITQSALKTFVLNLKAHDIDTVDLSFFLQPETSDFIIESRTELWKSTALDESSVTVIASDRRNQNASMIVNVKVIIPINVDRNETFEIAINEELPIGTVVTSISVPNFINFQFLVDEALEYFHLDNHMGDVTLTKQIDRDTEGLTNDRLSFSIRAAEKTSACSLVNLGKLVVVIQDINDVKPEFKESSYTGIVIEELVGAHVLISPVVEIVDPDLNNFFTFTLKNHTNVFDIVQSPGEKTFTLVTKVPIDRDDGVSETFSLTVNVNDGVQSADTVITVTVEDVNDNIPTYKNTSFSFSVPEDAVHGQIITYLWYEDNDKTENGTLNYRDNSGLFAVGNGLLTVDGPLDRERLANLTLELTVCDMSVDHKCRVTTFVIYVTDVNDNAPVFISPTGFNSVPENITCSPGNPIVNIVFADADAGLNSQLSYRVTSQSTPFDIDQSSGALYCTGNLDFEGMTTPNYEVGIEACDGGIPRNCFEATVIIAVTDVNDNAPVFLDEFQHENFSTSVESKDFVVKSKPVTLVSATDYDSGSNGDITFELGPGNGTQYMVIDSTNGLISTKIGVVPGPQAGLTYRLTVEVRDKGHPSLSITKILTYTVNSGSAAFEFEENDLLVNLTENEKHLNILNLQDQIAFENGNQINLTYKIPSSSDNLKFEVDRTSGKLSMNKANKKQGKKLECVPSDLFTSSSVANTLEISLDEHSPSDVLVFSLPTIVGTSTVQRSSCTVNVQSVFYCNISSGTVNVYVKTTDALMADDIYYRLLVHATAEVDYNGISGSVERSVKLMKPVKRYSAFVVDTAQPGHQLMYLPINNDVGLKVNSTDFSIDEKRIIYVKRILDSLHDSSTIFYTIVIKVYEELSHRTIAIIDVYVVRPKVQINVPENVQKSVVSFEKPGTIDVRLADNGNASEFLVGTNVISMRHPYDYEQITIKMLFFTAQFNSPAEVFVESRVSVLITDEDDVPPSFDKRSVTVTITQSALKTFVLNLKAHDIDTADLSYSLQPKTSDFIIESGTELWKSTALNASSVTVIASDRRNQNASMSVNVKVIIPINVDSNETFEIAINEELPIGTVVTTISDQNFQFLDDEALEYFHIDNHTGNVTLTKQIDRDTEGLTNDRLSFSIRAAEKTSACSLVNFGKLVVVIKDINDVKPEFKESSYTGIVIEELVGAHVLISPVVEIVDPDLNNFFTFTLKNHTNVFEIKQTPGEKKFTLETKVPIDRDDGVSETFSLTVNVNDGVQSADTVITVTVEDVNDNIPTYKNTSFSFSVPEDAVHGQIITYLWYEDKDKAENGTLNYRDNNGLFAVDDGVLTVDGPLDRERVANHTLELTVCDMSVDHKCNVTTFVIDVTDVNDNAPVFISPTRFNSVPENITCSPGNPIVNVVFTDADAGLNSRLSYNVTSQSTPFNIDQWSGALYCTGNLDFEGMTTTYYEVGIKACDGGTPRNCSEATVFIEVTDINDNAPVFLAEFQHGNFITSVESDDFVGKSKPVTLVSTTDYDSGSNGEITFELGQGNGTQYMVIDSTNGLISTKIDVVPGPQAGQTYTLKIIVNDKGQPSLSSTTTLTYTVNSSSAAFEFEENDLLVNLTENEKHLNILNLQDQIAFENGNQINLTYELPSSSDTLKFEVDRTSGKLSMKATASLDREEKAQHLFPVRALGNGASTLALVTVNVLDVNDNPPVFSKNSLKTVILVKENEAVGSVLLSARAIDADEGNNAITVYPPLENPISTCVEDFKINVSTGDVYVGRGLDYDSYRNSGKPTVCYFKIQAIDAENSSLTDSADVTIEIIDVNDNEPKFVGSIFKINMAERTTAADKIKWEGGNVTDDDMRGGANGDVDVAITDSDCPFDVTTTSISGNDKNIWFSPREGTLLDYETRKNYTCNVTATDNGQPKLSSSKTFVILLTDVNDNKPEVTDGPYEKDILRSAPVGFVVFPGINATDKDEGNNAQLSFKPHLDGTLGNAWDFFNISLVNGEISVWKSLNKFGFDEAVLSVKISDRGEPMLYTLFKVTINVSDENQRPYFGKGEVNMSVTLEEETYYGIQSILTFKPALDYEQNIVTCDCDYELLDNNDKFYIRPEERTLFMRENEKLDRESTPMIVLKIVGQDKGVPRKTTDPPLTVTINVKDLNDNPPRFTQPSYETTIFQEHPLGETFFKITAVDLDASDNAITRYNITMTSPMVDVKNYFNESVVTINETTGKMKLNGSVQIETEPPYYDTFFIDVTVLAVDVGMPDKQDKANVKIYVNYADPNRYAPKFMKDNYRKDLVLTSDTLNKVILTVQAYDNDTNNRITYMITSGNVRDTFKIQPETGNITQIYPIDDVVLDQLQGSQRIEMTVVAVDNGTIPKTGTTMVTITLSGNAQPCGTGAQESTTTPPSTDDSGFRVAMFVLIAIVCVLLVSNTYFIIKYCRRKPPPRREQSPYDTDIDKRKSKDHDYNLTFNPKPDPLEEKEWVQNEAYHSNQEVSRGLLESRDAQKILGGGQPPALPPRQDPYTIPPADYDGGYTSPSNEEMPIMQQNSPIMLQGISNSACKHDSDVSLLCSKI